MGIHVFSDHVPPHPDFHKGHCYFQEILDLLFYLRRENPA
jgi:hypothetical protein